MIIEDRFARAAAIKQSLRDGSLTDDELRALAADLPPGFRRLVSRWAGPHAADVMIDVVREHQGDRAAARLLPRCGVEVVRRLLPELDHLASPAALARRHPQVLLEHVGRRLADEPGARAEIWDRYASAVLHIADEHALELVEQYAPAGTTGEYGRLAARFPARVAALLATTADALPRRLARRLAALPDDQLLPLARRLKDRPDLLAALPPARRGAVHRATVSDDDLPSTAVLEVLPHDLRAAEAARALTLDRVRDQRWRRREYLVHLPWDEVRETLVEETRSSTPHIRGAAFAALVRAARISRDPAAVVTALEELARLRHERDAVRGDVIREVARLAPVLGAAAVPALTRVVGDAVAARSTSANTYEELVGLACAVLGEHPGDPALTGWALDTVARIARAGGLDGFFWFATLPGRRAANALVDGLGDWLDAGPTHGDPDRANRLAAALRRRARQVPSLQERLAALTGEHRVAGVAEEAIGHWLADPATRRDRTARLLAGDPSAVAVAAVWAEVSARRTDLLDDLLLGDGPRGGFLPFPARRWTPRTVRRAERWTPEQRAAFVRLQGGVAGDRDEDVAVRSRALRVAARAGGGELVRSFVDDPDPRVAEAAVMALAQTPGALPVLVAHLDTDLAHAAVAVLPAAARSRSPRELAPLLGEVLLGGRRVAGRKAAARLLGRYGPAGAAAVLAEAYRQPGQHGDVRVAIVGALRERLDEPESWSVLGEAVHAEPEERWAALATRPGALAVRHRARYAALVRDVAVHDLGQWLPYLTGIGDLVVRRFTDLAAEPPDELVARLLEHPEADALRAALLRLAEMDLMDGDAATPRRDRPARRRIEHLVGTAQSWALSAGPELGRGPAVSAARALGEVPGLEAVAARLLAAALPLRTPDLIELATPRPVLAAALAEVVAERVTARDASLDPAILLDAAATLAARGDLAGGLLAVAVMRAGARLRWPDPWQRQLRDLRQHPEAEVRDAACAVRMGHG